MSLERQVIEKKDFPIGRRGYDPDAVDAHLAAIADEIDQLRSSSRRRTETLASTASAQVRTIVEAAESSAAEITRQAEEEATEIRAEASREAATSRQQASSQAREYVGQVSESTAVMLQRLDAMESELSTLLESLRTGSNRLNADLQLLSGNFGDVRGAVTPRPRFEPEPGSRPVSHEHRTAHVEADAEEPVAPAEPTPDREALNGGPGAAPASAGGTAGGTGAAGASDPAGDVEGARLVALNMALNGTPRDDTDRYLAQNFQLGDRTALLDEVYASVEG